MVERNGRGNTTKLRTIIKLCWALDPKAIAPQLLFFQTVLWFVSYWIPKQLQMCPGSASQNITMVMSGEWRGRLIPCPVVTLALASINYI